MPAAVCYFGGGGGGGAARGVSAAVCYWRGGGGGMSAAVLLGRGEVQGGICCSVLWGGGAAVC